MSEKEDKFLALRIKKLSNKAKLPKRCSKGAAGYDLFAAEDFSILPGEKALVAIDLSMAVPPGYYGRIAPKSSLAWKNHIDIGAGVIDEDYRGPIGVVMYNLDQKNEFKGKIGDKIAQLILTKIITPEILEVDNLDETERGEGGFGSTGTN